MVGCRIVVVRHPRAVEEAILSPPGDLAHIFPFVYTWTPQAPRGTAWVAKRVLTPFLRLW